MTPTIVLVTGLSATGKTIFAREIAERFELPLFIKDDFKEAMFENVCPDGDYARMDWDLHALLGRMSFVAMAVALRSAVRTGHGGVFEGNFDRKLFSPVLAGIGEERGFYLLQAHLVCDEEERMRRFIEREKDGSRHPGHQGLRLLADREGSPVVKEDAPLDLPSGETFRLDTTDFDASIRNRFSRPSKSGS